MLNVVKAKQVKKKARVAICGPSGTGKTYSALRLASGMGKKILLADTENNSSVLYAGQFDFDVADIQPPYTIEKYLEVIAYAEENGYDVLILDQISHAWAGVGGLLDEHDRWTQADNKGNSYTAWRKVTPKHNSFVDRMVGCKCNLIATMRSKVDYVQEKDDNGKTRVKKLGMAPIQREGMDYEFDVVFDVNPDHSALASKSRLTMFNDVAPARLDEAAGKALLGFLNSGAEPEKAPPAEVGSKFENNQELSKSFETGEFPKEEKSSTKRGRPTKSESSDTKKVDPHPAAAPKDETKKAPEKAQYVDVKTFDRLKKIELVDSVEKIDQILGVIGFEFVDNKLPKPDFEALRQAATQKRKQLTEGV